MHKILSEVVGFFDSFKKLASVQFAENPRLELLVAPVSLHLASALAHAEGTGIRVAAQTCHEASSGAYTGEVAIPMLTDLGIRDVIVGHSERRQYYNETDESVALKVINCIAGGVRPIMCVGESLADRESGRTEAVLRNQLDPLLSQTKNLGNLTIAYEPVWAIGTGLAASAEVAQSAHQFIRQVLMKSHPQNAPHVPILYGGSVKPGNIESLIEQEDIDGALVGGASLQCNEFVAMATTIANMFET